MSLSTDGDFVQLAAPWGHLPFLEQGGASVNNL